MPKKKRNLLIGIGTLIQFLIQSLQGEASEKATLVIETEVDMYKELDGNQNPFFKQVTKIQTIECMIKFDYQNMLRMEREKVGLPPIAEIISDRKSWNERIGNSCLKRHKTNGQIYLEYTPKSYKNFHYEKFGNEISRNDFEEFLKSKKRPVEIGKPKYRLVKIENVRALKIRNKIDAVIV